MSASPTGNLGNIVLAEPDRGGWLDMADGRFWSALEIDCAAGNFAAGMIAKGFRRGDRVAILAANSVPFIIAYLGLMRAGLVAVPVNHRLPPATISHILADCAAAFALVDHQRSALLPNGLAHADLARLDTLMAPNPADTVRPTPGEIAEILYTSGSTGMPKGVPLSHEGQLWALDRFIAISSHASERTIIVAPSYHMNGLFFSTIALALGYFTISMPAFDARTYLHAAAEHRATILSGIPTMFALMAREGDLVDSLDLRCVKEIIIGSAPLTQALVDRVGKIFPCADIRNSYGTTETGPAMFGPHPHGIARPPLAIGYPYPGVEWRLAGGHASDEGLLETRTPATFGGYLNRSDAQADRLRDGWYSTGDILRRDADGFFHFVGRADDMFVCGGENIYPGEVEKLLERHPAILEAAILPTADEIKGAIPIAFVVPIPGHTVDPEEIRRFALDHGPAYAHPRAVVVLERMPTNGTHKIDRLSLRERANEIARSLKR